jgi:hypothetical protein
VKGVGLIIAAFLARANSSQRSSRCAKKSDSGCVLNMEKTVFPEIFYVKWERKVFGLNN